MDKKTWPAYMLSTRDPPQNKRSTHAESEWMGKNIPSSGPEKKAGVAILISDKNRFPKIKTMKRDKFIIYLTIKRDKYIIYKYITFKGTIHQEAITLVNIYAHNIGTPKYIRKILEDFK